MSSTITELRTALAANATTAAGIVGLSKVPPRVDENLAVVRFGGVEEYRSTFGRGVWEVDLEVDVLVPVGGRTEDAELTLEEFVSPTGPSSIVEALEVDRTLAGKASTLHVSDCSDMTSTELAGKLVLICTLKVHVYAK